MIRLLAAHILTIAGLGLLYAAGWSFPHTSVQEHQVDKPQKYGIFSAAAVEAGQDTFRFRTPTGGAVVVTTTSEDPAADFYKWPDKVCVGEIVPWTAGGLVRTIKGSRIHTPMWSVWR